MNDPQRGISPSAATAPPGSSPRSRSKFPNAYEVKALSPHHRFVIALHSPGGVAETGLPVCPPEKNARKRARDVRRATFSGAV
jgi:hypothetical protein